MILSRPVFSSSDGAMVPIAGAEVGQSPRPLRLVFAVESAPETPSTAVVDVSSLTGSDFALPITIRPRYLQSQLPSTAKQPSETSDPLEVEAVPPNRACDDGTEQLDVAGRFADSEVGEGAVEGEETPKKHSKKRGGLKKRTVAAARREKALIAKERTEETDDTEKHDKIKGTINDHKTGANKSIEKKHKAREELRITDRPKGVTKALREGGKIPALKTNNKSDEHESTDEKKIAIKARKERGKKLAKKIKTDEQEERNSIKVTANVRKQEAKKQAKKCNTKREKPAGTKGRKGETNLQKQVVKNPTKKWTKERCEPDGVRRANVKKEVQEDGKKTRTIEINKKRKDLEAGRNKGLTKLRKEQAKKPVKQKNTNKKCTKGKPTKKKTSRRTTATITFSGTAPDIGKGWRLEKRRRDHGVLAGNVDKYWFSPKTGRLFRSKSEILRFLEALKIVGGNDEDKAWELLKTGNVRNEPDKSCGMKVMDNAQEERAKTQAKRTDRKKGKLEGTGRTKVVTKVRKDGAKKSRKKDIEKPAKGKATKRMISRQTSSTITFRGTAPDVGKGWRLEKRRREHGTMAGYVDNYWFSPKTGKLFRSRSEIQRFLKALKAVGGKDEDKAWELLKKGKN